MRRSIIIFLLISFLLSFIPYSNAQIGSANIEEEIFPILQWVVRNKPKNWYYYLRDLVDSYSVATNLKIDQQIKNGDEINLKFRAPSYVTSPNKRLALREGNSYMLIREITESELNSGYLKFVVPELQISTPTKPSFVYFGIYEEDKITFPEKRGKVLVVTPPLRYTYVLPKPKITIVPQIRTQEIREIRPAPPHTLICETHPAECKPVEILYKFKVENTSTLTPFYLNSITLTLNNQTKWPFKEIFVQIYGGGTAESGHKEYYAEAYVIKPSKTVLTISGFKRVTKGGEETPPPLVNDEYEIKVIGIPYTPQDRDYPYTNRYVSFSLTSVTAKDKDGKIKVESKGTDRSHTYKIIVPYYPNVTVNAKVGSEEYPALVYEKQGDIATLYFTSFTGRFNAIRAGIQLPGRTIEVNQNCNGTCPRTYEGLVAKFGSPDKWAIPLIRWDWSKTAQYTLNMYMNCRGTIPTIVNNDSNRNKSFIFICSNRKAFGNNFGWNRQLTLRLNWAMMTGNEKLNYEVFYPEVIKLTFRNILQKTLPALMFKGGR